MDGWMGACSKLKMPTVGHGVAVKDTENYNMACHATLTEWLTDNLSKS